MRSGTLNVPGIVAMGVAATLSTAGDVRALRNRLESEILAQLDRVQVNGHRSKRLANTTNLSFGGVDAAKLMKRVPDRAVSSTSACTSALLQPSYVLGALGCDEERIRGSLRFSLGRFNTAARSTSRPLRSSKPSRPSARPGPPLIRKRTPRTSAGRTVACSSKSRGCRPTEDFRHWRDR